jgi:signal transduction histidine kinase
MPWRIRYQLLVPLLVLGLGVAGVGAWQAMSAASSVRDAIETRIRNVAQNLTEGTSYPLTETVLIHLKRLSGADYLLIPREGIPVTTLGSIPDPLPQQTVTDDWQTLQLGPPLVHGQHRYLCSGILLRRPPRHGEVLYILYPESLLNDALGEAIRPVAILGTFAGLAAVAMALFLGRRLGQRINELERQTRRIASGDFNPMPVPAGVDEVRDLALSINEMAQKLALYQESALRSERLRLLGQVGGGLAHQLRNSLTGAKLALQLFLREAGPGVDTEALEVALRQLAIQESHLQRFLQLGRAETVRRVPVDLREVIQQARTLLEPRCRHADIPLKVTTPAEPLLVEGDSGQLGQVLLNLLGNSLDAVGSEGSLEIRSCRQGDQILLDVVDTGPGPAPEVAERLFEPFVTGKPEGIGLGLAVVRQIVEAHAGRVGWFREGDRTCFRVELPAWQANQGTS